MADPLTYTVRWRVRQYELDSNGHVNNAVYLNYAEQLTAEHAQACGYGRQWTQSKGGGWVIHRHEVTYHAPALFGDELELTVNVLLVKGVRGVRQTLIRRMADLADVAEVLTEWVWVLQGDGRPGRVPQELVDLAAEVTSRTLAKPPRRLRPIV